ncbi:unnamed protein product [Phytophthora fragariaefolia]|uniref:Unnamed protein product n=1 Tax=Phytophthora fragariaefolia TaxID=1490495 RepID=A0A9W6XZH3_9STRA|nr:unnamed protein product [Phytophthora fragariaefolia]
MADIQIGKHLAQFAGHEELAQPWVSLEREVCRLINQFEPGVPLGTESSVNLSGAQANTNQYATNRILDSFADLERRRKQQEKLLCQHMNPSHGPNRNGGNSLKEIRSFDGNEILVRFNASRYQERTMLLWSLVEHSLTSAKLGITDDEALQILISALEDTPAATGDTHQHTCRSRLQRYL